MQVCILQQYSFFCFLGDGEFEIGKLKFVSIQIKASVAHSLKFQLFFQRIFLSLQSRVNKKVCEKFFTCYFTFKFLVQN